jgi:hypothetical protein
MGLRADLTVKLDAGGLSASLLASLQGPAGSLAGLTLPVTSAELEATVGGFASLDASQIASAVAGFSQSAAPLLASLPDTGDVLAPLTSLLDLAERATEGDLNVRLGDLLGRLAQELDAAPEGSLFSALLRVSQALAGAREGEVLFDLLGLLTHDAGLPALSQVDDALRALDGLVRLLGGAMVMESVLSEAERLALAMSAALDAGAVRAEVSSLQATLTGGTLSLRDFVAGVDAEDPAMVAAAMRAVLAAAAQLESVRERLSAAMGLGEATLVYLDIDELQIEIELGAAMVRTADLAPLGQLVSSLAAGLRPLLAFDLAGAPARGLDAILDEVEGRVGEVADAVRAVDLSIVTEPLAAGIEAVSGVLGQITEVIEQIVVALRTALDQVRAAVSSLPVEDVADGLRGFLQPLAQGMEALDVLLEEVQTALEAAAGTAGTALEQIDGLLGTFKGQIDSRFAEAKAVIEKANLDQVAGTVAGNVQGFADVLAAAQMKPYFDTAVDVIGTTADVVAAVPFGLLPESMKAEVDAAVRPVKEVDAQAFKVEIKMSLGVGAEGRLDLRGDLEEAVAGIQEQYGLLLEAIEGKDPRPALRQVDARLEEIAGRVREIEPALTLEPVRSALDEARHTLQAIDLDALLQPVRDAFDQVLAAIDEYSPVHLIQPLEQRLDEARTALLEQIHIGRWGPVLHDLHDRALALLGQLDPARLEAQIAGALQEVLELVERFPRLSASGSFGTVLESLLRGAGLPLAPSSFQAVLSWARGEPGTAALNGRAARIADALTLTRDAVRWLDVEALGSAVTQDMADLRQAVQGLIDRLADEAPEQVQLTAVLPRLDAGGVFGGLAVNRSRYLQALTRAASLAETLRRTGFSEVDVKMAELRASLAPLAPARDFVLQLLGGLGITDTGEGIAGVLRQVLAVAPPSRLAGLLVPVFTALRDRLEALLTAVLTPLEEGIGQVEELIGAVDLTPLTESVGGIVEEVKDQILRLHPDEVLGEPLEAFTELRQTLEDSDPLAAVLTILEDLRELVARVLEKLELETLLESPLAIYDHILAELRKLDLSGLLGPVFEQLDVIGLQLDTGLDETVEAFERLQDALPAGGGGSSGSVTVSGSIGIG